MSFSRILTVAVLGAVLAAPASLAAEVPARPPAHAPAHPLKHIFHAPAERAVCLSRSEQRAAVASKRAISLAQAIRSLRAHGKRAEVVRARLCRRGDGLVYVLTLLARSGKVIRLNVDSVSGEIVTGR